MYPRRLALTITRSPAQKSACKDLGRNDQTRAITPKATYTPTSTRAGSRSLSLRRFHFGRLNGICRPSPIVGPSLSLFD
ncbi:Conserved protein [Lacticaseibacillus rhamnosus GG]|nr:Conserved protein [Lacticaseibacillus rhamnosus GG]